VPNKRVRLIATILAVPAALAAVAIVRAGASDTKRSHTPSVATSVLGAEATDPGGASVPAPDGLIAQPDAGNASSFGTVTNASATTTGSSWIRSTFPKQAAATQSMSDPPTTRWALLIGINDYQGSTESNVGSKQDAQSLYNYLRGLGWRSDHMILVTDLNATASHIIDAIRWLASKTTSGSTVVFHYAGHENWRHSSSESDGRDIAIWAADNRMIYEHTLGAELGRVNAYRMWIDFATCRAAGFDEPGMVKPGRVLTFSSPKKELSYEDPSLHHSVFGWFLIVQAIASKHADANGDGKVSVEEAFGYAKNRVTNYTSGRQHPVIIDKAGSFFFPIPPKKPSSSSGGSGSVPTPSTSPRPCAILCL
jgi:hypothetical protein